MSGATIEDDAAKLLRDCGDNGCVFRHPSDKARGLRTNGGCRCWDNMSRGEQRVWIAQALRLARRTLDVTP